MSELVNNAFSIFNGVPIIRALLGILLVFFLPGFVWSFVFLKQVKLFERLIISVPLSVILITLSVIALNRFGGFRISGISSVMVIIGITVLGIIVIYAGRIFRRRNGNMAGEA